jgi:hypothetical protein
MGKRLIRWLLRIEPLPSLELSERDLLADLDPGMLEWGAQL